MPLDGLAPVEWPRGQHQLRGKNNIQQCTTYPVLSYYYSNTNTMVMTVTVQEIATPNTNTSRFHTRFCLEGEKVLTCGEWIQLPDTEGFILGFISLLHFLKFSRELYFCVISWLE